MFNYNSTAIKRNKASAPAIKIVSINNGCPELQSILDYGCGHGKDVEYYSSQGFDSVGYDPYFFPEIPTNQFDLVTCTYVLNILPPEGRIQCLNEAIKYVKPDKWLFIAVRSKKDIEYNAKQNNWKKYSDGYITNKNTFQKGFDSSELSDLIRSLNFVPDILPKRFCNGPICVLGHKFSLKDIVL